MEYDNPFPGMNPYLERTDLWRDFHNALISALANDIGPRLPHKYRADLKQRTEVEYLCDHADSMTRRVPTPSLEATNAVRVLMPREVKVTWLQVEAAPDREVVTVIEVLSPTNKAPGTGRYRYLRKREAISASYVNLVEIDLLRRGQPMPLETSLPASDYRILVCRGLEHPSALLYPFTVQQAVPKFPLPLLPDDEEPEVDLGTIINGVHHTARYGQVTRYHEPPPEPEFAPEVVEWVGERVASFLPSG